MNPRAKFELYLISSSFYTDYLSLVFKLRVDGWRIPLECLIVNYGHEVAAYELDKLLGIIFVSMTFLRYNNYEDFGLEQFFICSADRASVYRSCDGISSGNLLRGLEE